MVESLEVLRRRTLYRLRDAYAAGHVTVGTLEHRVEATLGARSPADLHEATWDLPSVGTSLWESVRALVRPTRHDPCHQIRFRAPGAPTITIGDAPQTWLIGRSRSCDLTLRDPAVSRRHALVSSRGGICVIRDLDSTNGLLVNGIRVSTAVLCPSDVISFGGAVDAEIA